MIPNPRSERSSLAMASLTVRGLIPRPPLVVRSCSLLESTCSRGRPLRSKSNRTKLGRDFPQIWSDSWHRKIAEAFLKLTSAQYSRCRQSLEAKNQLEEEAIIVPLSRTKKRPWPPSFGPLGMAHSRKLFSNSLRLSTRAADKAVRRKTSSKKRPRIIVPLSRIKTRPLPPSFGHLGMGGWVP